MIYAGILYTLLTNKLQLPLEAIRNEIMQFFFRLVPVFLLFFPILNYPSSMLIANTLFNTISTPMTFNFSRHLFLKTTHLSAINFNPLFPLLPP